MGRSTGVIGEFIEDGGFRVRIGYGTTSFAFGGIHHLIRAPGVTGNLAVMLLWILGNVCVLTMLAKEITPHGTYGKCLRTGEKMKQWLFFHRIDVLRNEIAVHECIELPAFVLSHSAKTSLTLFDLTRMVAKPTVNLV